jgi:hypothetical protein
MVRRLCMRRMTHARPYPASYGSNISTSRPRISQIPPDLVVKFQAIDIAEVILWLGLRLRVVYQQEIKG